MLPSCLKTVFFQDAHPEIPVIARPGVLVALPHTLATTLDEFKKRNGQIAKIGEFPLDTI